MKLIVSKSTYLAPIEHADAKRIFALTEKNRSELGKWLNWVKKTKELADTKGFVSSQIAQFEAEGSGTFKIVHEDVAIGVVSILKIDSQHKKAALGYWLDKDYWGKGIMTEAVKAICRYGFGELGLHRMSLRAAIWNIGSRKVAEKAGFTYEGVERDGTPMPDGSYLDMAIYSLLEHEL